MVSNSEDARLDRRRATRLAAMRWLREFCLAGYFTVAIGLPLLLAAAVVFRLRGDPYHPFVWYAGMAGCLLAGVFGAKPERVRHPAKWMIWAAVGGWTISIALAVLLWRL